MLQIAAYKVSRSLAFWFWRRRFFKVFTIYGYGQDYGQDHLNKLSFPHPREAPYEIWLWLVSEEKTNDDGWRQTTTEAYLSYKLTSEP